MSMLPSKGRRGRPVKRPNLPTLPKPDDGMLTRVTPERKQLTQAKIEIILQAIREGGSPRDGAALAGVNPKIMSQEVQINIEFAKLIAKAEIECKMHHVRRIYDGQTQWQASAWFLERRWAREFSIGSGATEEERTVYVRRVIRNKPSRSVQEQFVDEAPNKGGGMQEIVQQVHDRIESAQNEPAQLEGNGEVSDG